MTEPTVTQTVRAMMERQGALMVLLALVRHYWKPIVVVAGVIAGFAVFIEQFHALQKSNQEQAAAFKLFAQGVDTRLGHLEGTVETVRAQQVAELANWNTITTEAKIVISPKAQTNAPAEVRKGKIHR